MAVITPASPNPNPNSRHCWSSSGCATANDSRQMEGQRGVRMATESVDRGTIKVGADQSIKRGFVRVRGTSRGPRFER